MKETNIYERIDFKLKELNSNRKKMCSDLNIPYSTLTSFYQSRSGNITLSTIKKISDYLNCSIDFLVNGKEKPNILSINNNNMQNKTPQKELGEIECEILKICSHLSVKNKNALLTEAYRIEKEINN